MKKVLHALAIGPFLLGSVFQGKSGMYCPNAIIQIDC